MGLNLNEKHKVQLEKEKETLLITLYAKALDNQAKHPILHDKKAAEILDRIDYEFEKLDSFGNGNVMVVRARQMDAWLQHFLDQYPAAVVLNLGCGLDTRISRIDPNASVQWYDVDYPEVIELRKQFFSNRDGYEMMASSVTEPDWLTQIPRDKPVMIIAEGILEYLAEDEVRTLFNRLTDHFPHGQIAFDVMNTFAVQSGQKSLKETTGAEHKWAVDDTRVVEKLNPKFKNLADFSVFQSQYMCNLQLKYRLIYGLLGVFPNFKNMLRLLRYKF